MSYFKIKVTADLDTSQVEAKLMTLQNRKITIQANAILWILEFVSYLSVQMCIRDRSIPICSLKHMYLGFALYLR